MKGLAADVVITAVGSSPLIPEIPGLQEGRQSKRVVTGREVLAGEISLGKKVVIMGGGMIGSEIADFLAEKGLEVTIVEILPELAMDAFSWIRKVLLERLKKKGVRGYTGVKEENIVERGLEIIDSDGKRLLLEADQVVISVGSTPNTSLSRSFRGTAAEFYEAGDCREARKILEAIHEGYEAAAKL